MFSSSESKADRRKADLEDSLQAQQYSYFANANKAERWICEKEPIVGNMDYGKDEDSAEALLKKHEALMSDINSYKNVIDGLHAETQKCKVRSPYH